MSQGEQAEAPGEQLTLLGQARAVVRAARAEPLPPAIAEHLPVARVAVDVPLAHLDRTFDYLVPATEAERAAPGVRVRVRFAGQVVDGYLLERAAESEHGGRLARLHRVVSPEPALTPEVLALARDVGTRYAGTLADVLRLAVPPRHARVEGEAPRGPVPPPEPPAPGAGGWADYENGPAFLAALADGRAPRAVWTALPSTDWTATLAAAAAATLATGRGVLVVVPDARDLARVGAAFTVALGAGAHVELTADLGPAERYRRWLAVRRGAVRAVVGTRAAMFAPVADLGLVVVWDDGDDLHAEPRAPYPHVREVLCLRAHTAGAAALIGGHVVTAEAAALLDTGWAHPLAAARSVLRDRAPRVRPTGEDYELAKDAAARSARLPSEAWQAAREGLAHGPVLVQVPRRGYLPGLACNTCRARAQCPHCAGPIGLAAAEAPARCTWCGRGGGAVSDRLAGSPAGWACPECGGTRLRAVRVGAVRTAEELGRAFPGVPVRSSNADGGLATVGSAPALIVATPGAEPVADGGYAAALLLDSYLALCRPDLRSSEEALRRWANAAALVRPGAEGGQVVLVGDAATPAVQALVRWDPAWFARRELADRRALGFPPAVRLAALTGPADAVADLLSLAQLPPQAEVLGPVPVVASGAGPARGEGAAEHVRTIVRVSRAQGGLLVAGLRGAQGVRSARKSPGAVRVQVDPAELG